ncbi:MAG: PilZ domain-containing protein [Desulfobacterales bacterium]
MSSENRKHQRIASLNLLHVEVYKEENIIRQGAGRTLNISESGILLEIHFPIDADNVVQVTIGLKEDLLEIRGKSVRCLKAENGKYQVGILFDKITTETTDKILKKYIKAFTAGKSGMSQTEWLKKRFK